MGRQALESGDQATLDQLLVELSSLGDEMEALFRDWEDPPGNIEEMVEDMDEAYLEAGEAYLEVCELIQTALSERKPALLTKAQREVEVAAELMREAEGVMRSRLFPDQKS